MLELEDSIEINTSPENIFQWFMDIDKNYVSWHPEHIGWEWIKGKPFEIGSKAAAREYFHGKAHNLKSKTTHIKKNELVNYKFLFPISIILPKGSFILTKTDSGSIFTATLSFRAGKLLSKIFKKRMEAIIKHMKEEGANLKRLLEKD